MNPDHCGYRDDRDVMRNHYGLCPDCGYPEGRCLCQPPPDAEPTPPPQDDPEPNPNDVPF